MSPKPRDIFQALIDVSAALPPPSQTTFVHDVTLQAKKVIDRIGPTIPHFVFARCLIGTGPSSLEYEPTDLLWNNDGLTQDRKAQVAAGFATYLAYGRAFSRQKLGHALSRTMLIRTSEDHPIAAVVSALGSAVSPGETGSMPAAEPRKPYITSLPRQDEFHGMASPVADAFRATYEDQFRKMCGWDDRSFAALDTRDDVTGQRYWQDQMPVDAVSAGGPLDPEAQTKNTYGIFKLWFELSGLREQWLFSTPHQSASCPWGGMYFIFDDDLGPKGDSTVYLLAMLTQTIFLQAHWRDMARRDVEQRAQASATRRVRLLLGDLVHALQGALNTGIPESVDRDFVQRNQAVTYYKVLAVSVLEGRESGYIEWDAGWCPGEDIGQSIAGRFCFNQFDARINATCLNGQNVHPCFPALLIELFENASKRRWVHPRVELEVRLSLKSPRLYRVECRTCVRGADLSELGRRLAPGSQGGRVRGIGWILQLFHHLSGLPEGRPTWTFRRCGEPEDCSDLKPFSESDQWSVQLSSAAIAARRENEIGLLEMAFVADGLNLIKPRPGEAP